MDSYSKVVLSESLYTLLQFGSNLLNHPVYIYIYIYIQGLKNFMLAHQSGKYLTIMSDINEIQLFIHLYKKQFSYVLTAKKRKMRKPELNQLN
jgi:hypothetical protein